MAAFGMDTTVGSVECRSPDWSIGATRYPETESETLSTCASYVGCVGSVLFSGSANFVVVMESQIESGIF